jgi:hypothetical protein
MRCGLFKWNAVYTDWNAAAVSGPLISNRQTSSLLPNLTLVMTVVQMEFRVTARFVHLILYVSSEDVGPPLLTGSERLFRVQKF